MSTKGDILLKRYDFSITILFQQEELSLVESGNNEEALTLLDELSESYKTHGIFWDLTGDTYRNINKYDESLNAYKKGIDVIQEGIF